MSNHSDFEYISQWYGANGARRARRRRFMSAAAGRGRQRPARGPGAGVRAQRLQRFTHRAETVGAGVEHRRSGDARGEHAHVGEVVGMDELVAVVAAAEHEDVGAVGDPVEQDPEDAEAAVTEDRPRPHDGDVEALRDALEACPFGSHLA